MIDLHIHSWCGVGTDSVIQIIENLKTKGISKFSITDHDTVSAADEILNRQSKHNLKYIPGVEFNTLHKGEQYHITAYGRNLLTQEIREICNYNTKITIECDNYLIENVSSQKHIETADYESYEHDRSKGYWKSFHYLKDLGLFKEAKKYFEWDEKYGRTPQFIPAEKLLRRLNEVDAYSVLAHPQQVQQRRQGNDFLNLAELYEWKKMGIQGIEAYNSHYEKSESVEYYKSFCRENGLFITGGSDYHGHIQSKQIGHPEINEKDLDFGPLVDEFIQI